MNARIKYFLLLITICNAFGSSMISAQEIILEPPVIDSISVDTLPNGQYRCVLGWEPYDWTGFNTDSSGFVVSDVVAIGGYSNPDTLRDAFLTFYFDSTSNPMEEIQGFGLHTFTYVNGVRIKSAISDQESQNMQVKVAEYDSCNTEVALQWNTFYDEDIPLSQEPPYRGFCCFRN
jgi:hypothetical protein